MQRALRQLLAAGARVFTAGVALVVGLAGVNTTSGLVAQDNSARVALTANELDSVLQTGLALENEGRWAEALQLYQRATRTNPTNTSLRGRYAAARMHFDIERRYADASYIESLRTIDPTAALNLYGEVLAKIQTYYVDTPDWASVAAHSIAGLELALNDSEFRRLHAPQASPTDWQNAITEMRHATTRYQVNTRQDAFVVASGAARLVQRHLGVPLPAATFELISGAVASLDPYSAFMTANQYSETMSQIEGNFVGLGVELRTTPTSLEIVSVIPEGTAGLAGMIPGDRITAVEDQSVEQLGSERAADMLRGAEGSMITISVERGTQPPVRLTLERRRVDIPSVEQVRLVDPENGVGYIRLSSFQKNTTRDFDHALWQLQRQGMRSLIVDVRGNPGGLLTSAVDIANRFLNQGVIVSTRGRNPQEDHVHVAQPTSVWRVPLVVLIDDSSASASEILAAAIGDHERGVIVGQRSYGKGSVQGVFPLEGLGCGLRLTTAKFYSPSGQAISGVGVQPDVDVQVAAKPAEDPPMADTTDASLRTAIQVARRHATTTASSR